MPELPEVEVTRQSFAEKIKGAKILSVQQGKPLRWPLGCSESSLLGQHIHQVRRRGKYLLLDLDQGLLLIHLGMSGRLTFAQKLPPLDKHDHFEIQTNKGNLRLHDPRRFGAVVWSADETGGMGAKLLGHLGMEPLSAEFDEKQFLESLKKRQTAIKQVLLSGHLVVGVGNIYASEALYKARIDPRKSACKISKTKALTLLKSIQNTLQEAITHGGTTLKDFQNADGEHGLFQLQTKVYGRTGQACPECRHPIRSIQQGQRTTFFCAYCQK